MKKFIAIITLVLVGAFSAQAQEKMKKFSKKTPLITLEQTPGEFTKKEITVDAGTYIFAVNNKDVGHDVGFVLVKKGQDITNAENHIKTAYVTAPVANNTTGKSKATKLTAGEYYYFCPLNPTATDNILIVK
ncbi:plastocyanin/azurin family copper-binding protein [Nonlabens antarcticus]|uniref:plastocyanin/azurin family copper-binding protein n=1 Tax=Nonlabens antarcticus TaxID=392714 RepID=UPI0018915146|nr:plastocyanin/azurin family copper-binding protein [Nonlabens antarcticus]